MTADEIYSKAHEEFKAKNYSAALKILDDLKKFDPNYKHAYYLEATIWHGLNNPVKEYYALEKILPLLDFFSAEGKKFATVILDNLANVCSNLALNEESFKFHKIASSLADDLASSFAVINNTIFSANFLENFSADDFRALYNHYEKILNELAIHPYPKEFYAHKKIRVGFLSANFFQNALIHWAWALLTKFDKNLFKIYCYSTGKNFDKTTYYLHYTFDVWRDIYDLADEAAAEIMRVDEIDILFDLDGRTNGNRLPIAAYRPASVQISGVGYMNSTGLDCFDYFLSDVYCAGDEKFFTEKVIKLPHSHICYKPFINVEPESSPPCLKNNFVTFGTFNQFGKITDSMLTAWKKILDAVPESHLLLKSEIFNSKEGKNFVGERLKTLGFDLTRVEMRPYTGNHLVEYGDIDIALDTFPYTGGVTTCEALYMGVPVISLYGSRHGTRFGLSILKNIGLDELAVPTYDEYINRAIILAGDCELLKILRKNLRTMMKKSPLMDSESYIREIEETFMKILYDERRAFHDR